MSELTQAPKLYTVPKMASLVHDIFFWSRGNGGDDGLDPHAASFLGYNFGDRVNLELLPEVQKQATQVVANTRTKYHILPSSYELARVDAESTVSRILSVLRGAVESGIRGVTPAELGPMLVNCDWGWIPEVRQGLNDELKKRGQTLKPIVEKPYMSNVLTYGFLGKSTGQHAEYDAMFRVATNQLVKNYLSDEGKSNGVKRDLVRVKDEHIIAYPEDAEGLREKYPVLF